MKSEDEADILAFNHIDDSNALQNVAGEIYRAGSIENKNLEHADFPIFQTTITNWISIPQTVKKFDGEYDYLIFPSWELLTNVNPESFESEIVVLVHDLFLYFRRSKVLRGVSIRSAMKNLKEADKVIANSKVTKDVLENTVFLDSKIDKIDLGVNKDIFYKEEKSPENIELPDKYVLYVGSFDPRKNIRLLFDVMDNLPKDYELLLAGGGYTQEDKKSIESEIKERGIKERVQLTGFVKQRDLRKIYSNADTYLHPALRGGFELTPIEAAACGTPVLVQEDIPSAELLEKENTFENYDAKELAERITSGKIGNTYSLKSWEDTAKQFLKSLD